MASTARRSVPSPRTAKMRGVGVLTDTGVNWIGAPGRAGRDLVLVPSESVLVLPVDLPLPSRRRQAAAAPFAVEGKLAEPLSEVSVALGPEIAPRRRLVAVVRRAVLDGWSESLVAAGVSDAAIAPDYVALPRPEEGSWAAWIENDRVVIRAADDTGFAIVLGAFAAAWNAGGRPRLTVYAGEPPAGVPHDRAECDPTEVVATAPEFDLRGRTASEGVPIVRSLRALAAVLLLGVAGHLGLAAAETAALRSAAEDGRAQAAAFVEEVAPGVGAGDDVVATLAALAPRGQGQSQAVFLDLLSRTSVALAPFSNGLAVRNLSFDGAAGALTVAVEAPDLAALQRIEAALAAAGLAPEAGAATMARGAAEARFVVRGRHVGGVS